jgi:predicted aspartyl protease
MSVQIGYLDTNGHPRLTIRISGTHPTATAVVEAMIDTGFTGFLMLPIAQALPLGLALYGTGNYTLADGSSVTNFLAEGTVTVLTPTVVPVLASTLTAPPAAVPPATPLKQESASGTVVLGGDGALLGMEFLRTLDKLLLVGKVVMLVDNSLVPIAVAQVANPVPSVSSI